MAEWNAEGSDARGAAQGGCRCGAVAVRAVGDPTVVVYCHCRDCRRSSGAPVSLFAGYRSEQVEFTGGEPTPFESSPGVHRSFCRRCGTPISFEDEGLPGETYLPIGIFDDPEAFEPEAHDWVSRRLGWFDVSDGLPRHAESSIPARERRIRAAVLGPGRGRRCTYSSRAWQGAGNPPAHFAPLFTQRLRRVILRSWRSLLTLGLW